MEVNDVWPNGMPAVGQVAQRYREVLAHDIELFTDISGDRNPLHYDELAASATPLGGIVVQGGITTAILNAVVAEDLPGPGTVPDGLRRRGVRTGDAGARSGEDGARTGGLARRKPAHEAVGSRHDARSGHRAAGVPLLACGSFVRRQGPRR